MRPKNPLPRFRQAFALASGGWLLVALPLAAAHDGAGHGGGGFMAGVLHPLLGPDHVVAMLGVGLWAAWLGAPAIWQLPLLFPLVMAAGSLLGAAGVPLPGVEIGIALSGLVLGLMVAAGFRTRPWVAAAMVSVFALLHGHAHGTELPEAAGRLSFGLGFVLSAGLLHLAGVALGLLGRWRIGRTVVRGAGGLIALLALGLLVVAL